MKKETIVAISFGVGLGLVVAIFMIINLRGFSTKGSKTISGPQVSPKAGSGTLSQPLELSAPQAESITFKNSTTIAGKASKGSLIVVQSAIDEKIFKNAKEDFSITFPLALGENVISISVYPTDTKLSFQQKILKIYYLDEQ